MPWTAPQGVGGPPLQGAQVQPLEEREDLPCFLRDQGVLSRQVPGQADVAGGRIEPQGGQGTGVGVQRDSPGRLAQLLIGLREGGADLRRVIGQLGQGLPDDAEIRPEELLRVLQFPGQRIGAHHLGVQAWQRPDDR